jgi:hypothetical protein
MTTQTVVNNNICVVAVCKSCGKGVIYKYVKVNNQMSSFIFVSSGIPMSSGVAGRYTDKPDIEWCNCGSDDPRHLCRMNPNDVPGLEIKCEKCECKFICASSRIEVVYEGVK